MKKTRVYLLWGDGTKFELNTTSFEEWCEDNRLCFSETSREEFEQWKTDCNLCEINDFEFYPDSDVRIVVEHDSSS